MFNNMICALRNYFKGTYNNNVDAQYLKILINILAKGTKKQNRTGIATYSIPHQMMSFDLSKEFPLLTSKFVGLKTATKEMLWIWQDRSNDVNLLNRKYGVKIWDEWKRTDGTIGKAYGYQLAKEYKYFDVDAQLAFDLKREGKIKNYRVGKNGEIYMNQVDKLIYDLHYNKDSRRMVVSLWNVEDLNDMELQPCAFLTEWNVEKDKLHCLLNIRSNDFCVGNPYNIAQYAMLTLVLAKTSGLKPVKFTVMINDCHVYENHYQGAMQQLSNKTYSLPEVILKDNFDNFYEFDVDCFEVKNYKHSGKIEFEVAV